MQEWVPLPWFGDPQTTPWTLKALCPASNEIQWICLTVPMDSIMDSVMDRYERMPQEKNGTYTCKIIQIHHDNAMIHLSEFAYLIMWENVGSCLQVWLQSRWCVGPVDIKVLYSMVNGLWGMVVDHFEPFCLHHLRTIRYIYIYYPYRCGSCYVCMCVCGGVSVRWRLRRTFSAYDVEKEREREREKYRAIWQNLTLWSNL